MSKMGEEMRRRLEEAAPDLYWALKQSRRRIKHTAVCNVHRFDNMTPLAEKTMLDCGYDNKCDCDFRELTLSIDEAIAKVEGKNE